MKVLVSGGAGFIGSHTVDALLKKRHEVRILDSLEKPVHLKGKPGYIPKEAEFILGDVRNKADWEKALDGVEAVFHFAAYQDYLPDFSKFFHVNSVGTALLYETIVEKRLPVGKVVVASSQAVMGEGAYCCTECDKVQSTKHLSKSNRTRTYPNLRGEDQLRKGRWDHTCEKCDSTLQYLTSDESVINPQSQYAISKYNQELMAINLGKRYDIPSVALRYSIVQGPRQSFYNAYSGACRIFCLNMFFDREPVAYEDGNSIRDYVNIEDVVGANMLVLADSRADYQVLNVGGGRPYTVKEFAEIVADVYGNDLKAQVPGEYRYGDTRHILSDCSKLEGLGWRAKNSPDKSVIDYVTWLKQQENIEDILEFAEKKMKDMGVVRSVA